MHIYHVASGTPVVTILRPARTPKGTEVRTVIKHVTKRMRRHWPKTRIVWRGDSHYGRIDDLVVMPSGGRIFAFFALRAATRLKIQGAFIPRRVFTQAGPVAAEGVWHDMSAARES
jgi:hypothetical protein